ncbi:unnamed protein product (mitochondrion) [Plasmodiophora brassicae]|uniref:Uncharacterized protein n=1 Tax=Plasmodiophora brassicae TaxID=37360 RepID=A0A0G4IIC0_PLABS|nr:hypothetical protein PBRA_003794 [Plasmodiophora brassicae]SPQ94312.1 unnamed protein product [Plasmodiophora brassicae]
MSSMAFRRLAAMSWASRWVDMARRTAQKAVQSPVATRAVTLYGDVSGTARASAAKALIEQSRSELIAARRTVENAEAETESVRQQLAAVRETLEGVARTDSMYPKLVQQEHVLLRQEQQCLSNVYTAQTREREQFEKMCSSLEHASTIDADRSKWFSIVATIIGTLLGAAGSSLAASSRQAAIHARLEAIERAVRDVAVVTSDDPVTALQTAIAVDEKEAHADRGEDDTTQRLLAFTAIAAAASLSTLVVALFRGSS